MDVTPLQDIGLTSAETRVYLAVLELGSSLAGEISKKTGMHRRSIYDAVERLLQKGLIAFVKKNNRKYFQADHPQKLLLQLKEKEHNLTALLPELALKYSLSKERQEASIFTGVQGLKAIFNDQIQEQKEILVFGASTDVNTILQYYLPHYENARIRHQIPVKIIYDESARNDIHLKKSQLLQVRFIPQAYRSPSSTNIYGDNVAILLWSDEPLAILIKNKRIAEAYRKFFALMWKIAKA